MCMIALRQYLTPSLTHVTSVACVSGSAARCFEVSLARSQNLKLAWEDAWNQEKMELSVKWLSHGSVRP